jgi:hypothetical protein
MRRYQLNHHTMRILHRSGTGTACERRTGGHGSVDSVDIETLFRLYTVPEAV